MTRARDDRPTRRLLQSFFGYEHVVDSKEGVVAVRPKVPLPLARYHQPEIGA